MIPKIINYQFSIFNIKISGKDLVKHPLFSGSAAMILGTNFANLLGYLYHLVLGRLLGPSSYSELAVSLSALGLIAVSFSFLGLVINKFISSAEEKETKILINWFINKSLYLGIILLILFLLLSPTLAAFLHLNFKTALLFGPTIFFFLFSFLYKSFLQGLIKFKESATLIIADVLFRLISSVILVLIGLSAFGAVCGILIGAFLSFILGIYYLRKYVNISGQNQIFKDGKKVLKYAFPVFIISLSTTSFFSSDVILVKHFFSSFEAGIYSALSTLGKIIYYGAGPVTAVMFPLISQRYTRRKEYRKILMLSIFLTLGIAGIVVIIFWLFPELSVIALFGKKYITASNNLVWFSLFMLVYTIANLIISFYLSIEKTRISYILPFFALFQILGIILYHDSILQVIKVSLLSVSLLLISLVIYLRYDSVKPKA